MKKRILALAMTLVMVFSSMAVLSTVSFAADGTDHLHFDASWNTVSAYHATVAVDGNKDAYVMVQEYLSNSTRYGVAWDYDNLYLVFASAGKKVTSVDFTVGAQPAKLNVATATVTGIAGATAKGNGDYIEVAIPMKEIFLHFTPDAAYAPLELKVVSESATAETKVNVEITGKTMVFGYETGFGNKISGRGFGFWSGSGAVTHKVNSDSSVTFAQDAATVANKSGRAQATVAFLRDLLNPFNSGVDVVATWDITVGNLPASAEPTTVPHGYQADITTGMVLTVATKDTEAKNGDAAIFSGFVYNDANQGLSLLVPTMVGRTSHAKFDLGVNAGEKFRLTLVVDPASKVTVIVNGEQVGEAVEVVPHLDSIATGRGAFEVSLVTKKNESANVTLHNADVCLNPEVDYAKLKTVAKNNYGAALEKVIVAKESPLTGTAYAKYGHFANVGSFTKVEAVWSYDKEAVTFRIPVSALNSTVIKNGDNSATVALTVADEVYKATVTGIDGATVVLAYNVAYVTLPLRAVTVRTDAGNVYADFVIKSNNGAVTFEEAITVLFSFEDSDAVVSTKFNYTDIARNYGFGYGHSVTGNRYDVDAKHRVNRADLGISQMHTGITGGKQTVFGYELRNIEGTKYLSYTFKVSSLVAVPHTDATFTAHSDTVGNIAVIIREAQEACATFNGRVATVGYDYVIKNVIPEGGTEDDATICLIFNNNVVIDTGKAVGDSFNIRVEWNEEGTAAVYVDGTMKGTAANAVFTFAGYNHPTGAPGFSFRAKVGEGNTVDFEYTTFETGFAVNASDINVAEFVALTANTIFDQPEVTDPEEMIELYAVQNKGKASDEDYAQRLVATIDTLDYKYAGFQIAVPSVGVETYRVYDANTSILDGDETTAIEGKYFITYTLDETDEFITGTAFVRAFAVDADRNYVYGDTYKVTIDSNGVLASAELVVNPGIFN